MQKIFIAEDDESIRELLDYALKNSGFQTFVFADGENVLKEAGREMPSLILLDIMMPVCDGLTLLSMLRENSKTCNIPVIMLTAKSTEMDKIKGLDLGADDYMVKPFSVMELISRVKAVLRRSNTPENETEFTFGQLSVNPLKRIVKVNKLEIELTYKEFEVLLLLLNNKEKVLSRDQIINAVWNYDYVGESRTVDMHIKSLRHKLGECGQYIATVRNVGYVLKIHEEEVKCAKKDN